MWKKILGGALGVFSVGAVAWEVWQNKLEEPKKVLPATSGTKSDFVAKMKDAIGALIVSPAAQKLAIAWAAFESNWGRTTGFTQGNNPWNITSGSKWTGDVVLGPDTEYDASGKVKNITQKWRKYPTLHDAVLDMLSFLEGGNAHYGTAQAKLLNADPTFSDDLRAGGYYTLDATSYKNGVAKMLADPVLS